MRVPLLLIGCLFGCKGSPSVPAPWDERGAPKAHLIEVGTANADAFYGVYDQDPRGVVLAFREGLAKGGFVTCGEIGHNQDNGMYWSFFRAQSTLWILEVSKNGERSPFNLTKYKGVTSDQLTASGCAAEESPVVTPVDAGVDVQAPLDAAVVDAAVGSAASPQKGATDRVPTKAPRKQAVSVVGGLSHEDVQRSVERRLPSVRMCREKGMRTNPTLAGRVMVKLVVDASGAVTSASDSGSDLPDQEVVACVVRALEKATFPASGKVTTIVYPFAFAP